MTEIQLKDLIKGCIKTLNEGLRGLSQKDFRDMVRINVVHGVSTLDFLATSKENRLEVYNFIFRKCRWVLDFEYPISGRWAAPFRHFFQSEGAEYGDWLRDFQTTVLDELNSFRSWLHFNVTQTTNRNWLENYYITQEVAKKYPTFERDLTNLLEFIDSVSHKTPQSPLNPKNYPLYVSLYITSREYGGPQDGGWYYNQMRFVEGIKVNTYKEARAAVVKLIKDMKDNFGNEIVLEKEPKTLQTQGRPDY